jgi:RNA-directed DNA polymerase
VVDALERMGYGIESAKLLAKLFCLNEGLVQGAPSSPVLSNICFQPMDEQLVRIANKYKVRLTRYADDIVFSGTDIFQEALREEVTSLFEGSTWRLAEQKIHFSNYPKRLKVHGLLVHGEHVRLTKGYRNRLRAFQHLLNNNKIIEGDIAKVRGHLVYGKFIESESKNK